MSDNDVTSVASITAPSLAPANGNAPAVPSLLLNLGKAFAQKGLTAAATALAGYGVIAPNQEAQLISLGISAVAWAVSFAWTWLHEKHAKAVVVAALNAPPPSIAAK